MSKQAYDKGFKSVDEQIDLLKLRGMQFLDESYARAVLEHVNYYRLRAYWLPFEIDETTHRFRKGTIFERVMELYLFDRQLRLLLIECLELIEVSIRTHLARHLSEQFGAHGYLNQSIAKNPAAWSKQLQRLVEEVNRSHDVFILHFREKYQEPLPPIWAASEVMSFGTLSKWYKNVLPTRMLNDIARTFKLPGIVLASWLHHLTTVRNIVAHHSRVWNRQFTIVPRTRISSDESAFNQGDRRLYNTIVILQHMRNVIEPTNNWAEDLHILMAEFKIEPIEMGFPSNWKELEFWKSRCGVFDN